MPPMKRFSGNREARTRKVLVEVVVCYVPTWRRVLVTTNPKQMPVVSRASKIRRVRRLNRSVYVH